MTSPSFMLLLNALFMNKILEKAIYLFQIVLQMFYLE